MGAILYILFTVNMYYTRIEVKYKNSYYIMKYITSIIKKLLPKEIPKPVGRWRIEQCSVKMNNKIDLSNEDHCGPCGQYALEKIEKEEKEEINNNKKLNIRLQK